LTCEPLQRNFIELVHNSAMEDGLKSSPIDVLWVVSSRNGTCNNGTNLKVGKNSACSQYWGGGLEFEREVCGKDFEFVLRVLEFGSRPMTAAVCT